MRTKSRVRGDRRLELFGGDLEAGVHKGRHDDGCGIGDQDHVRIRHPIGRGDDDLIPGIEQGQAEVEEALLGATGDQDLLGRVVQCVVTLEFLDDRLLQAGRAVDGRILGEAALDRVHRRRLDVFRGVEIRLSGAQPDHVLAAGLERCGAGGDRKGGEGLMR